MQGTRRRYQLPSFLQKTFAETDEDSVQAAEKPDE
jgi:hypothetical protein